MKHFYTLFCVFTLVSFNTYSQSDLIGTWYLDHIVKDDVTYPNYFNDNTVFDLELTDNPYGPTGNYEFTSGHGCNSSTGVYSFNSNEIIIDIAGTTLADCVTKPFAIYESLYYVEFNQLNGDTAFSYAITGTGNEQVLTLTNPNNSNTIIYKKQQPTTLLISTWWLHHIDIPGNPIIDIPEGDSPLINFTNEIFVPLPLLPELDGIGECEVFNAKYSVSFNGANNLSVSEFVATLSACATQAYEGIYFNILSDETSNFFEFEITEDGSTLILTYLLGAKLIYGDTSLSLEEQTKETVTVSILQNPVKDYLKLNINNKLLNNNLEYRIYAIDGKLIKTSDFNTDAINVSQMQSGIYYISFTDNNTIIANLKFIKK
ncbi:T9SS type A sorting domain-containing protein [Winogradskyella sp.]|jgi:hypothetical protein|uniref:T9SS type A sorting domain-containing protein n=1 Tax=Winogradskyella sp. TaxID=1883156 RepID=UPI0025DE467A|nr:T9SS type A sorting domain-containing protein [Winogradskyella sp.]MCT4629988.1 T9SS type A sorting domain-containing protein [Winogradskyella sp.]